MSKPESGEARRKACYVGAPKIFALETACRQINEAFGDFGCYLVGSAIERADWRDVDIRFIMADKDFAELFPDANTINAHWEHDPRWLLINTAIAEHLSNTTGLPVDFQIQPQTFANAKHNKVRHAIGLKITKGAAVKSESGEPMYVCDVCDFATDNLAEFQAKVCIPRAENQVAGVSAQGSTPTKRVFYCTTCGAPKDGHTHDRIPGPRPLPRFTRCCGALARRDMTSHKPECPTRIKLPTTGIVCPCISCEQHRQYIAQGFGISANGILSPPKEAWWEAETGVHDEELK